MIAISFQKVNKVFNINSKYKSKQQQALKNVTLDIHKGRFFGLLGSNGAGKSTLINSMSGLVVQDSGKILIHGYDTQKQSSITRKLVGLVPQELINEPFFDIRTLLEFQSGYFGLIGIKQDKWIDELLEILNLHDKQTQPSNTLSGGMKRRLLIAMALVHQPEIVVLDEPTAGVDIELRANLWEFTNKLHRQGKTIILTTHYLEEAEDNCDEIAIIKNGEIISQNSTIDLMASIPYTFVEVSANTRMQANKINTELEQILFSKTTNQFLFKINSSDNIENFIHKLNVANLEYSSVLTRKPTLHEVFIIKNNLKQKVV